MVHAARALGLGVMIGCMVESSLGIAASCPVASLCDHVDLDGNVLLAEDPWEGVALVDGVQLPPSARASASFRARRREGEALPRSRRGALRRSAPRQDDERRGALRARPGRRHPRLDARGGDVRGDPDRLAGCRFACFGPTTAIIGVAPTGGVLPPVWRELLESVDLAGARRRVGMHDYLADDPELAERGAPTRVELRDLRRPPDGDRRPDRREPPARCPRRPHRRLGLCDREEDHGARARPRGAPPWAPLRVRPDRPNRDRDRRLGHRRRLGRLRLRRRGCRAARGRRRGAGRPALGRGPGLARPSLLLGRHARPLPRSDAPRPRPLPQGGRHAHRGASRSPDPAASRSGRALRAGCAARAAGAGRRRSRSTR